ncbi:MAG: hypothetical protein ABF242_07930 [Flavobacteriales bacterium]
MLVDYSRRPIRITKEINELVGKSFPFMARLTMNGIGSHRMKIEKSSVEIFEKLSKFENIKYGSVELRPKGIIVHFKDNLTHWIWAIPYYKLVIYQTEYDSIHANGNFINFNKFWLKQTNTKFFRKIGNLKVEYMEANYGGGPNS